MKTVSVQLADDEVLVAFKRDEGYEDVHPQLLIEDALGARCPFQHRLVEVADASTLSADRAALGDEPMGPADNALGASILALLDVLEMLDVDGSVIHSRKLGVAALRLRELTLTQAKSAEPLPWLSKVARLDALLSEARAPDIDLVQAQRRTDLPSAEAVGDAKGVAAPAPPAPAPAPVVDEALKLSVERMRGELGYTGDTYPAIRTLLEFAERAIEANKEDTNG